MGFELQLLETTTELVVADTETLDRWDDAVVLSAALTYGDLKEDLSLEQLIEERTFFMKFDAKEQIKELHRKVDKGTVSWWNDKSKVTDEARKMSYYPDITRDRSVRDFATEYVKWAHKIPFEPFKVIHCDRNLFDMRKLQHIIEVSLHERHPWDYHNIIDVVSTLKAWGTGRYGGMDIRKMAGVVYHDPRYDAAVDWLRIQNAARNFMGTQND
jgi:hypothetical protein